MSETEDPRAALRDGDVATRAAAARDLARAGTWDDVAVLVEMAKNDNSPSVRLYTAAAAADIVGRMRGQRGQRLTRDQKAHLSDQVKTFDPGVNPSLLMLLSAVADQSSIDRLGRMLRDPRNGVRAGAATALRRMALSAASAEDDALSSSIDGMLGNKKMPPDAILELVKLVGEAGWDDLADTLRQASAAGRLHGTAVDEALQRLAARRDPAAWEGLWVSDGADVFETVTEPRIVSWLVVSEGVLHDATGEIGPVDLARGRARVGDRSFRMVWAPRVGEAGLFPALQSGGTTWYQADAKGLVAAADELSDVISGAPAAALARWLAPVEGVLAQRARAIALWRAGDLDAARESLEGQVDAKKPRTDLFWFLANVRHAQGDRPGAAAALDEFLEKAGKRARFRKEAEELRAELG